MRISVTESSSVILSKTVWTGEKWFLKVPKQGKTKMDGVINPQNYNFNELQTWKIWCSQNATNQLKSTVEIGYMCPRGLFGPQAVTFTKFLKFKKRLLLCCKHHFKSDLINNMNHKRISDTKPSSAILSKTM